MGIAPYDAMLPGASGGQERSDFVIARAGTARGNLYGDFMRFPRQCAHWLGMTIYCVLQIAICKTPKLFIIHYSLFTESDPSTMLRMVPLPYSLRR